MLHAQHANDLKLVLLQVVEIVLVLMEKCDSFSTFGMLAMLVSTFQSGVHMDFPII